MNIRESDIRGSSIFGYLRSNSPYRENPEPIYDHDPVLEFSIDGLDTNALRESVIQGFQKYGYHPWLSSGRTVEDYRGVSLTYNPNHTEGLPPHRSTLGTNFKSGTTIYFDDTKKYITDKRNTHLDTYAFHHRTEFMNSLAFPWEKFKRTIVRSRCATIDPNYTQTLPSWPYHTDEPITEMLRINVPVQTNEDFMFEVEGHHPYNFKEGHLYSFDAMTRHSVYATSNTKLPRINLVIGISPWFDYLEETNTWVANEYMGKHPLDMLMDGDIMEGLTFNKTPKAATTNDIRGF